MANQRQEHSSASSLKSTQAEVFKLKRLSLNSSAELLLDEILRQSRTHQLMNTFSPECHSLKSELTDDFSPECHSLKSELTELHQRLNNT
ncbi:hypothetical protein Tco_1530287 [Tanacetum coccineum]